MKPAPLTESQIAIALTHQWRTRPGPDSLFAHVPNGGHRTKRIAARMKAEGVLAGFPDYVCAANGMVSFLELKAVAGRISHEQNAVMDTLERNGAEVHVAYGLDDALDVLERIGVLRRAT